MPTVTFDITAQADSQRVWRVGTGYPPEGAITLSESGVAIVAKNLDVFEISLGVWRWDTSALPDDADISDATLRIYAENVFDNNDRDLTAGWMTDAAISSADYTDAVETTAFSGFDLGAVIVGLTYVIPLSDPETNINKTGYTKMRMMLSGGLPDNYNFISIPLFEHATLPTPTLSVSYPDATVMWLTA